MGYPTPLPLTPTLILTLTRMSQVFYAANEWIAAKLELEPGATMTANPNPNPYPNTDPNPYSNSNPDSNPNPNPNPNQARPRRACS